MNFEPSVSFEGIHFTPDELKRVWLVIDIDSPELFQIQSGYEYWSYGNLVDSVSLKYRMSREEYETRLSRIRAVAAEIEASIPASADDYDREFAVYRWLILNNDYERSSGPESTTAQADAALCNGRAQCSGYAAALSLLLRHMGIPCIEVSTIDEQDHQWNKVKINGRWYNCDVTWDDPDGPGAGQQTFEPGQNEYLPYLNVPDRMMTGHTPNMPGFTLPECKDLTDNYAVREGAYIPPGEHAAGIIRTMIINGRQTGKRQYFFLDDSGYELPDVNDISSWVNENFTFVGGRREGQEIPCFWIGLSP